MAGCIVSCAMMPAAPVSTAELVNRPAIHDCRDSYDLAVLSGHSTADALVEPGTNVELSSAFADFSTAPFGGGVGGKRGAAAGRRLRRSIPHDFNPLEVGKRPMASGFPMSETQSASLMSCISSSIVGSCCGQGKSCRVRFHPPAL
jgi:hypothetical protein